MKTIVFLTLLLTQGGVSQRALGVITGRLISADGRPAANARVALSPAGEAATQTSEERSLLNITRTDNEGRYRMEDVPAGRYLIEAGRLDSPTYLPGVMTRAGASVIALGVGSLVEAPEFRLQTTSIAGTLRIKGRLTGTIPPNQTQASLALDRLGGSPADRITFINVASDGTFEISELRPGTYEVYASNRVVSTFVLTDRDLTDLVIRLR